MARGLVVLEASLACLLALLAVVGARPPTPKPIRCSKDFCCPSPYFMVLDECFSVSYHAVKWRQARTHCQGIAGDLAVPKHLYALQFFIKKHAGSEEVFVGGNRLEEKAGWMWVDGRDVNVADWYECPSRWDRRPNRCLAINASLQPPLLDRHCKTRLRFACQYMNNSSTPINNNNHP
ncbi:secretory phospholipase A2 receptor-like [Procambarus clarkii]|uniref:secretory phospholipase A2 receptor-like n=1 Tax=Procambarus clarkii TaxID=6728 RepID=UPI0037425A02